MPFDPQVARGCDRGADSTMESDTPVSRALTQIAQRLVDGLEPGKEPLR
jgi:hypothetical protein